MRMRRSRRRRRGKRRRRVEEGEIYKDDKDGE